MLLPLSLQEVTLLLVPFSHQSEGLIIIAGFFDPISLTFHHIKMNEKSDKTKRTPPFFFINVPWERSFGGGLASDMSAPPFKSGTAIC